MTQPTRALSTALTAVFALVSLLGSGARAAPNDDARRVVVAFADAWNRHDLDAFGKLFASDAEFVNVTGTRWTGRQSIQAQHAYGHGAIPADSPGFGEADRPYHGIFRTSTLTFDPVAVQLLATDVAVAHVNWELQGDARSQNARHGVFIFVLNRKKTNWLIADAQNTEISRAVK